MNKYLIIYCHPYAKSFNHAILESIITNLKSKDQEFKLIDLYSDKFIPTYDTDELSLFHKGEINDPLVTKYLQELKKANRLIIITPYGGTAFQEC